MTAQTRPDTPSPLRLAFWFGRVDGRPASVFRMAFALLLFWDALYHLPLATFFYSDIGVVPRAALLELARGDRFSLLDAMPYAWMSSLVFVVWALVAVGLLVGYRTRLMAVLNFLLILSIHERNVYVLTGADSITRALSFWMIFIPLGAYYSLDARRALQAGLPWDRTGYAFPVRMMWLQVALVYLFAGWLKALGPMWTGGTAMAYIVQLNTLLYPVGVWLRDNAPAAVLTFMTYAAMVGELLFALLVFAPFGQPLLRVLGLLFGVGLHVGIGLMLSIPAFSIVMITSYLIFVPPTWLAAADHAIRRRPGRSSEPDPITTPEPHAPLAVLKPPRLVLTIALSLLMIGVIWWNVDYLGEYSDPIAPMPSGVRTVMYYSGLWQYWDLFSPMPLQIDGWITIPAEFEDGTRLDLRTGQPPTTDPQHIAFGPWVRWEKFEENVFNNAYQAILQAWGGHYCHEYNILQARPEGERLARFQIIFRYKRSVAPGAEPTPYVDELLWTHWCYDQYQAYSPKRCLM